MCVCGAHYILSGGEIIDFVFNDGGGSVHIGGIDSGSQGHISVSTSRVNISGMRMTGKKVRRRKSNPVLVPLFMLLIAFGLLALVVLVLL